MSTQKTFILGQNRRLDDGALLTTKQLFDRLGQNSGNIAFHEGIWLALGGRADFVDWGASTDRIEAMGDIGVIAAANQFGAHVDYSKLAENFSTLKNKLVMIGLGAQSTVEGKIPEVPQGTVDWVRQIAEHSPAGAPNIAVRGPFTKTVLEHYGLGDHAVVMGCPSLFINPEPKLGALIASNIRPFKRIAVPSGDKSWRHLAKIEASLARMVTATNGSYVGQHSFAMMQLTRGEAHLMTPEDLRACRDYACPEMDIEEFIQWSKLHGNLFYDVQAWMEHYRRFDMVVGPRIHGVMLALQAGVPGLCVVHDSRTLELCQTMMVPYVLAKDIADGMTRDQLSSMFTFDAEAFDANRAELAKRYMEFLTSNNILVPKWLGSIASGQA